MIFKKRRQRTRVPKPQKFELICRSSQKEIGCVERFLKRVNKKLHLDDGTMYRLHVSCTEAVNNAIVHGNKSKLDRKVIIQCIAAEKSLTVRVKDEGEGFDPENLTDPLDEKNLLKESGRGIFLIRSMMDKVIFKRLKHGFVVEMKTNLHR